MIPEIYQPKKVRNLIKIIKTKLMNKRRAERA